MHSGKPMSTRDDGRTHINVYSRASTLLGQKLSNFIYAPFVCEDGGFNSIEGYWYWLSTKDERLRTAFGFEAKRLGKSLRGLDWLEDIGFKDKIKKALRCKVEQNPDIAELMVESTLPFVHYYQYNGRVVRVPQADWMMEELELIRQELKDEQGKT